MKRKNEIISSFENVKDDSKKRKDENFGLTFSNSIEIDTEEFIKSIPYKIPIYENIKDILDLEPLENWQTNIQLYDYLISNFREKEGKINLNKLKSNKDFNDFFETYYQLEVLKRDIKTIINKEKLTKLELKSFNIWKKIYDDLDLGATFIIFFCTYKGHFILSLITSGIVKKVKQLKDCLSNLLYYVIFYYQNKNFGLIGGYNTSSFIYYTFSAIAIVDNVSVGLDPWRKWKEYHGLTLDI